MNELARRKAEKAGDSKLWSPLDALEDTIERIKSGEIKPKKLTISMLEDLESGGEKYSYAAAGVDRANHVALLSLALRNTLEDWLE